MTTVKITDRQPNNIVVLSPYNSAFVGRAKQLGGRWDAVTKAWVFDKRYEAQVRSLCREVYGTDNTAASPTVYLRVNLDKLNLDSNELVIGPIQAIKKWGRDSEPVLGAGVVVIAGRIKKYGGSARYPRITWEDGTILEVAGVPLELAQRLATEHADSYQIVQEVQQ